MKSINLTTESYLFKTDDKEIRLTPFYDLSIDEVIIYQNSTPKYLIDFNIRESEFITTLERLINTGIEIEEIINNIGKYLGVNLSTWIKIEGSKIEDSAKPENIQIYLLENLSDLVYNLYFLSIESLDISEITNSNNWCDEFIKQSDDGHWNIEIAIIDGMINLKNLMNFQFKTPQFDGIERGNKIIYNLTELRKFLANEDDIEKNYLSWIDTTGRTNTMDEYGQLIAINSFVRRNLNSNDLYLIVDRDESVTNYYNKTVKKITNKSVLTKLKKWLRKPGDNTV